MDENSVVAFIECCVRNSRNGEISFSDLIAQASTNRRKIISKDLERCIKENNDIFEVSASGLVTMKSEEQRRKDMLETEAVPPSCTTSLPKLIVKGQGCVIQLKDTWGLIAIKEPVKNCKTSFNLGCFGDKFKYKSLQKDLNIEIGAKVCFNAQLDDRKKQYKCSEVWKSNSKGEILHPEGVKWKKKTREEGRFDPHKIEDWGIVQKMYESHGFISVQGDDSNTVFFHKNCVRNVKNITDLQHVVNVGDKIEFKAKRTHKTDSRARWEAEEVLIVKQESTTYVNMKTYKSNVSAPNRPQKKETQFLATMKGKIFPSTDRTIIKFQLNDSPAVANVSGCPIYSNGSPIFDVNWQLDKGEEVNFEAKSIDKAPWWTATLVWTGNRPKNEPPCPSMNKPQKVDSVSQEKCTDRNDHEARKPKYQIASSQYASKFTTLTKQSRQPKQKCIPPRHHDSEESQNFVNSNNNDDRDTGSPPYEYPFKLKNLDWADSSYFDEQDLETDMSNGLKSEPVYTRNISESLSIDSGLHSESAEEQENAEFYNNKISSEEHFQQYNHLDVETRMSEMDINKNVSQKPSQAVDADSELCLIPPPISKTCRENNSGYRDTVENNNFSVGEPYKASSYVSSVSRSNEITAKEIHSHTTTALCKSTSSDKQKPPMKFLHEEEDSSNMELPRSDGIAFDSTEDLPSTSEYLFRHVKDAVGIVSNLTASSAELKFVGFEKPCKFHLWNFFIDGKLALNRYKNLEKAVNKELYLKFNYTKYVPTNDNMIAMVWLGDKPDRATENDAFERCEALFKRFSSYSSKPNISRPLSSNAPVSIKQEMPMPINGSELNGEPEVAAKSHKATSYAKLVDMVQPILREELPQKEKRASAAKGKTNRQTSKLSSGH